MSMVAIADLFGISGRRDELLGALTRAEADAAGADGCLRYTFSASLSDPDHFVLVSEWRNQSAMDDHYGSARFSEFQLSLNGLLARPSDMTIHTIADTVRPVASGPMDPRDAD
jgi:quinol monooxygenase YgiN